MITLSFKQFLLFTCTNHVGLISEFRKLFRHPSFPFEPVPPPTNFSSIKVFHDHWSVYCPQSEVTLLSVSDKYQLRCTLLLILDYDPETHSSWVVNNINAPRVFSWISFVISHKLEFSILNQLTFSQLSLFFTVNIFLSFLSTCPKLFNSIVVPLFFFLAN